MIDLGLINRFRDVVNANDFVLFKYTKSRNKNQWNCICSAMDWITVAAEYILKKQPKHIDSIAAFAYISSIDIIVEAVQQLHRVFYSTTKVLYANDKDVFFDNQFGQTDIIYFKTIRACFGAHPVNLNDPADTKNPKKKRFASWSGNSFGKGDFSVILYSNQPGGEHIHLSIYFKQLDAFLEKYYGYLEVLIKEIEYQYGRFCSKMKNSKFSCEGDPLTRLYILKAENESRLDNSYYSCTIDKLILFYETPVTCEKNMIMVNQYKEALTKLVDEIQDNLQNMEVIDLENDFLLHLHPESLQNGWLYWLEKLSSFIWGSGYPPIMWLNKIENIFQERFVFDYENYNELYLLVHSALYDLYLSPKQAAD